MVRAGHLILPAGVQLQAVRCSFLQSGYDIDSSPAAGILAPLSNWGIARMKITRIVPEIIRDILHIVGTIL